LAQEPKATGVSHRCDAQAPWYLPELERRPRLAPSKELFDDFQTAKDRFKKAGLTEIEAHNKAFETVGYRRLFLAQITQDPEAMKDLRELIQQGKKQEVHLLCYCGPGKSCHRFLLLELADQIRL